jgi:hypothetical protein
LLLLLLLLLLPLLLLPPPPPLLLLLLMDIGNMWMREAVVAEEEREQGLPNCTNVT